MVTVRLPVSSVCVFDMIGGMQEESEAGPRCFVLLWLHLVLLHLMPASKPCLWCPTIHEMSIVCVFDIVHQQAENIRR